MNTQEGYEQIREYFTRPGAEFGFDRELNTCLYRTSNGRKCAVGCLIPDEAYAVGMEGAAWKELIGLLPELGGVDVEFLGDAQDCHDDHAVHDGTIPGFIADLDYLAAAYGLKVVV